MFPGDEAEHGQRQKQWTTSISPCVSGPKGGPSAGVAVCTRSHIGMRNSFVEEPKGDGIASRLNVKWIGAAMAGGFHCGSLYTHDGVGIQHETNTKLLHGTAARLCMLQGPWVLSADFNCTPKELAATGFLKLVNGHIVHPKNKTCTAGKGRLLDFFVVSRDMLPFVHGAYNVDDSGINPHSPVRLIFGAKPRQDSVRVLKVPKSHPPVLPHGPERECKDDPGIEARSDSDLGNDYAGCVAAIEKQLSEVAGLDETEAKHFGGRADGPEFVMQQAGGGRAAMARTTSISRAWRRSADWLRRIQVADNTRDRLCAYWKLFHYKHPRPDFASASEAQLAAFREFEAWKRVIARTDLADLWVETFREMATTKAIIQQEGQAQRAQFMAHGKAVDARRADRRAPQAAPVHQGQRRLAQPLTG